MKSVNGKTTERAQNQTAHLSVGGVSRGFDQVTQVVQPNLTAEVPQQDQKLLPGLAELCPLTNFD